MPRLSEIIDRAEILASGVKGDANASPLVDSEVTAMIVYPHAVRYVIRLAAKKGENLENLAREIFISVAAGEGDLPDSVLREYFEQSYVPTDQFSSWIPYPDYGRYLYSNQIQYYTHRSGRFYYARSLDAVAIAGTLTTAANDHRVQKNAVAAVFVAADAGKRLSVTSAGNVIDAFIDSIDGDGKALMRGRSISTEAAATGSLYPTTDYNIVRSLTAVGATQNDQTVTCAGGAFTAADIGKRLRVVTEAGVYVVDSIIQSINSGTSVEVKAQATATDAACTADIMEAGVFLQIPAIPALPTDITDDVELSSKVVEDVIVCIASVLRGEKTLPQLIEDGKAK